jgi:LPS sulfotransferase NodH
MKDKTFILASARTGSGLLTFSLDQHPNFHAIGEILALEGRYMPNEAKEVLSSKAYGVKNVETAEFPIGSLARQCITDHRYISKVMQKADLCKILYWQMPDMDVIHNIRYWGSKVIHLHRRDLLAAYVSLLIAEQTGQWHANPGDKVRSHKKVSLDYNTFEHFIADYLQKETLIDHILYPNKIDVYYEDLVRRWNYEMAKVQKFLGLEVVNLPQNTKQTITDNHRELVSNFHKVRAHYNGTIYDKYFYRFEHGDWFTPRIPRWTEILEPFVGKPVVYLEIGSFEGRSATWMLDKVLTHPEARAVLFEPGYSLPGNKTLKHNLAGHKNVVLNEMPSSVLDECTNMVDIIYIDGDHSEGSVYRDGENAIRLVRKGGVICFDDYLYKGDTLDGTLPKPAIDRLIKENPHMTVIHKGYQLWMRRDS